MIKQALRYFVTIDIVVEDEEEALKIRKDFERVLQRDTFFGHKRGLPLQVKDDTMTAGFERILYTEIIS